MRDNSNPKLLVSKAEASEKIQDRINIGKKLYKVQIFSEQEYNNLRHERKKWVDYNRSLFDTLFDKSPLPDGHGYSIAYVQILNHTLFQKSVEGLKEDIDNGINQLESIHERLELYVETTQIREKLRYAKTEVIARIKGIKKDIPTFLKSIMSSIIASVILFHIGC